MREKVRESKEERKRDRLMCIDRIVEKCFDEFETYDAIDRDQKE